VIYGFTIDGRNFRKKIISTNLLIKTEKKDKSTSKKGAFVYRFNTAKYEQLNEQGYHLDLSV
ncbi:MAG: DNA mismatch repair protein MutT, partial [Marinoscillum sp.]